VSAQATTPLTHVWLLYTKDTNDGMNEWESTTTHQTEASANAKGCEIALEHIGEGPGDTYALPKMQEICRLVLEEKFVAALELVQKITSLRFTVIQSVLELNTWRAGELAEELLLQLDEA